MNFFTCLYKVFIYVFMVVDMFFSMNYGVFQDCFRNLTSSTGPSHDHIVSSYDASSSCAGATQVAKAPRKMSCHCTTEGHPR